MTDSITRRQLAAAAAAALWTGPPARAQQAPSLAGEAPGRLAPPSELVNTLEFEEMARRRLTPGVFADIAGGDRAAFERITFRQRLMVNSLGLDLSCELFGVRHFAPILAGPMSGLARFYPDGEAECARGAALAKTAMVFTGSAGPAGWFATGNPSRATFDSAAAAGCQAICVNAPVDWPALDSARRHLTLPLLLKGVMTPEAARQAVERGLQGIVVSSYRFGSDPIPGLASPIEVLPAIAAEVRGRVPILIDGGFRRGSDILKALALGARAVMVARPVAWGLSAYGAAGVQTVLELLQSELARDMAMTGRINLAQIDATLVRLDRR